MNEKPKYCIVFDRNPAFSKQSYILDWLEEQDIRFEAFDIIFGDICFSVYNDIDLVKINARFRDWIINVVEL